LKDNKSKASRPTGQIMIDPRGYITEEQVKLLLDNCRNLRDYLFVLILLHSGRRISELIELRVKDIAFKEGMIAWHILKKRTPVYKYIATDNLALSYLYKYIQTLKLTSNERLFPFTRQRADKLIKKIGKRAGIETIGNKKIHCHAFRHGHAAFMLQHGANIKELQMSLDHSRLEQTAQYLQFSQEDLRNKMNIVFGIKKKEEKEY